MSGLKVNYMLYFSDGKAMLSLLIAFNALKHPHVLIYNIRMLYIRTWGCYQVTIRRKKNEK